MEREWIYTLPGAHQSIDVAFDQRTMTEECCDRINITDGTGRPVPNSPFVGNQLSGVTINVPGSTVRIQLRSDDSVTEWGFRVTGVSPGRPTDVPVTASALGYPESPHPYVDGFLQEWTYTLGGNPPAIGVAFDGQTSTEACCDWIHVETAEGQPVPGSPFSGKALANRTVIVRGSTVRIRFSTDSSSTDWGFAVTSVHPAEALPDPVETEIPLPAVFGAGIVLLAAGSLVYRRYRLPKGVKRLGRAREFVAAKEAFAEGFKMGEKPADVQ
jgi:hypothetical protein